MDLVFFKAGVVEYWEGFVICWQVIFDGCGSGAGYDMASLTKASAFSAGSDILKHLV